MADLKIDLSEHERQRIRAEAVAYVAEHLIPFMSEHSGEAIIREAKPIADFIEKGEGDGAASA